MSKLMTSKEFVEGGFLQEVNRQFFHPMGLALSITLDVDENGGLILDDRTTFEMVLQDSRSDLEGFIFPEEYIAARKGTMQTKVKNVAKEKRKHSKPRKALLGMIIQKLPK